MKNDDIRRFEVVRNPKREGIQPDDFVELSHQGNLFPTPRPGLLIFVYFPDVTEQEFRDTVNYAKPSKVLELRSAPRFDIGSLNRKTVFDLFEREHVTYIDLTSTGGHRWNSDRLLECVKAFVKSSHLSPDRPMIFLLNKADWDYEVASLLQGLMASLLPQFTDYCEIPRFVRSDQAKTRSTSA